MSISFNQYLMFQIPFPVRKFNWKCSLTSNFFLLRSMKASILLLLVVCFAQVPGICSLEVRKEWRKLSLDEQAAWISAAKVRIAQLCAFKLRYS